MVNNATPIKDSSGILISSIVEEEHLSIDRIFPITYQTSIEIWLEGQKNNFILIGPKGQTYSCPAYLFCRYY